MSSSSSLENAIRQLTIPFPEKTDILKQLDADSAATPHADFFTFNEETLKAMEAAYNTKLFITLRRLKPITRELLELTVGSTPLMGLAFYIEEEVPMLEFLKEGGIGMWLILGLGAVGLIALFRQIFLYFIARDHSAQALSRHHNGPLVIAAATLSISLASTAMGAYVVLNGVADGNIPAHLIVLGMKESLSNLVVGGILSSLIFLLHWFVDFNLRRQQIPTA